MEIVRSKMLLRSNKSNQPSQEEVDALQEKATRAGMLAADEVLKRSKYYCYRSPEDQEPSRPVTTMDGPGTDSSSEVVRLEATQPGGEPSQLLNTGIPSKYYDARQK